MSTRGGGLTWAVDFCRVYGRPRWSAQVLDENDACVREENATTAEAAERKAKRMLREEIRIRAQLDLFKGRYGT